jgi:4-alpha-glucanotransferase
MGEWRRLGPHMTIGGRLMSELHSARQAWREYGSADIEAAQAFVETARRWLSWFCEYRSLEFEPRGAGQVAL